MGALIIKVIAISLNPSSPRGTLKVPLCSILSEIVIQEFLLACPDTSVGEACLHEA